MDIILLEKIHKLGHLGDKVSVKPGYWRNYLLPKNKAVLATPENIAKIEEKRAELEKAMAEKLVAAQERANSLVDLVVTIAAKVAEEGKLYGSLGIRDIIDAISQARGVTIEKSEVHLPHGPLRLVGEYDIEIRLHPEVSTAIKVNVVEATPDTSGEQ